MATAEEYARWIVGNADKRGTPEFDTVAKAYQMARGDPNAKYKAMQTNPEVDPTEDMNILQTGAAGLGKMMVDTGRGVKQLTGIGEQKKLQQTIDSEKDASAPLMDTWGGNIGNIAGQVGLAVLPGGALARAGNLAKAPGLVAAGNAMMAPPMTLGGLGLGAGMGAGQGAIQPVATGDERGRNMMIGAVGGAAVPAIGMAGGAIKGAVEPLYAGGRDAIIGRALRSAAGTGADDAVRNMQGARQLIPGSQPTAAEVANSGGIAAMQRTASAVDPESYATRGVANNAARVQALQEMAGTGGDRAMMGGVREMMTEIPYAEARQAQIPKAVADSIRPQIDNLMERPAMRKAVARAKEIFGEESIVLGKEGSVKGLQYMKQALDDIVEKASSPASSIGKNELRALQQTRSDLIKVMEEAAPKLRGADTAYRQWSKPINQMDVAQEIADKSINPLTGILQPQAFARNFSDDAAVRATGFKGATLANTMEPQQLGMLGNMREDLARSVAAQNLGRGAGSDTVQKLSMTNLMQQSGLPVGLLNAPGLGRAGNWAYSQTDDLMKQRLAQALLDPQQTAQLMEAARRNPALARAIEEVRRIAAPGILGGALSLNAQQ